MNAPPPLPKRGASIPKDVAPSGVLQARLRAQKEKDLSLPQFKKGSALLEELPDMSISEHVRIKGDLKFESLLRIDGKVEGSVTAPPKAGLIVGEAGTLIGNVLGIGCMLIEGKVIGNISVESLTLTDTAIIHGDVSCRSINIVPNATIIGQLHISAFEPLPAMDHAGNIDASNLQRQQAPQQRPKKVILFIIDPQVDFHDGGSCSIPNAGEDAERIAELISQNISLIDEIIVTLDTHHRVHIAHPIFWTDPDGSQPPPYTVITPSDVDTNKWTPRNPDHLAHCKHYLKELKLKEMCLTIKPEHCLKGSIGHTVVPVINEALQEWAQQRSQKVGYIFKSENSLTDMTSALTADVKIVGDPTTALDPAIMSHLQTAERLVVCGQSLSHGVRHTMRDLLLHWQARGKMVLLRDGSSPNPYLDGGLSPHLLPKGGGASSSGSSSGSGSGSGSGFSPDAFFAEMEASGVLVTRAAEVFLPVGDGDGDSN